MYRMAHYCLYRIRPINKSYYVASKRGNKTRFLAPVAWKSLNLTWHLRIILRHTLRHLERRHFVCVLPTEWFWNAQTLTFFSHFISKTHTTKWRSRWRNAWREFPLPDDFQKCQISTRLALRNANRQPKLSDFDVWIARRVPCCRSDGGTVVHFGGSWKSATQFHVAMRFAAAAAPKLIVCDMAVSVIDTTADANCMQQQQQQHLEWWCWRRLIKSTKERSMNHVASSLSLSAALCAMCWNDSHKCSWAIAANVRLMSISIEQHDRHGSVGGSVTITT